MKKNIIIAVLSTVVVAFIILLIVGLTTKEKPTTDIDYAREGFMSGCMGEDAGWVLCDCAYTTLTNKYGKVGLLKMEDNIPQEALDLVVNKCL